MFFDLLECLIQRDLDYKTQDIRQGRSQIRAALSAAGTRKVVLILHSQGGIEGSSILRLAPGRPLTRCNGEAGNLHLRQRSSSLQ
jgi:hypothetical protein